MLYIRLLQATLVTTYVSDYVAIII